MSGYLEVLGNSNLDSNPSFLLFFENSRYLVQVPEAFQRVCTENRVKLSKIAALFLTKNSCTTFSGLPGLSITVADMGVKKLDVFGPPGLQRLLEAVKTFSVRSALNTAVHEYNIPSTNQSIHESSDLPILWQDDNLSCKAVCVGCTTRTIDQSHYENNPYSPPYQHASNHQTQPTAHSHNQRDVETEEFKLRPEKKLKQSNTPPIEPAAQSSSCCDYPSSAYHREDDSVLLDVSDEQVSSQHNNHIVNHQHAVYSLIYQIASVPGKFDAQKAKQIGLQPGPLFAKLKAGQPIEMIVKGEFVRMVHPDECVGPSRIGPVICVIDCPLLEWIGNLVENPVWNVYKPKHASHGQTNQLISLMIHMAPLSVIQDRRYAAWIESFGPSPRHVLINQSLSLPTTSFNQSDRYTQTISQLDPTSFEFSTPQVDHTIPPNNARPTEQLTDHQHAVLSSLKQSGWPQSTFIGTMLDRFHLWASQSTYDTQSLKPTKRPSTSPPVDETIIPAPSIDPELVHTLRDQLTAQRAHPVTHHVSPFGSDPSLSALSADSASPSIDQVTIDQFNLYPAASATDIIGHSNSLSLLSSIQNHSSSSCDTRIIDALDESRGVPSLFFSGTGSAIPSKYRNVTGIHFDDGRNGLSGCIIDCGEGTLGQLARAWGPNKLSTNLAKLRIVFISHMHADHHLGLPSLVQAWAQIEQARREHVTHHEQMTSSDMDLGVNSVNQSINRRLLIVGPRKLYNWILTVFNVMHEISPVASDPASHANNSSSLAHINQQTANLIKFDDYFEFVANHTLLQTPHDVIDHSVPDRRIRDHSMWKVRTVFVRHCPDAFGLILTLTTSINQSINQSIDLPIKLVYSGDTLPCQSLIDAGADATILIHEATFEAGMETEAFQKRHSTNQQACLIGRLMRAKSVILTHFSQRYPKISMLNQSINQSSESSNMLTQPIVAFDLMRIDFNRLVDLMHLSRALQQLLEAQKDEEDDEA